MFQFYSVTLQVFILFARRINCLEERSCTDLVQMHTPKKVRLPGSAVFRSIFTQGAHMYRLCIPHYLLFTRYFKGKENVI